MISSTKPVHVSSPNDLQTRIDYHNLKFCEIIDNEGTPTIAVYDGYENRLRYIPLHELSDDRDKWAWDMSNAVCWQLPTNIDPLGGEAYYDDWTWEKVQDRFVNIANRILRLLERSMYFKDYRYPAICVNFIFNSYFRDCFRYAPRMILSGSTQSGKTRLQNIQAGLCYRGFATIKPTFASMFRLINNYQITPIIDEIQRLKGSPRDDLEDIFLSGDQQNRPIVRTNMNTLKTESFNIYAPMIVSKKAGGYTPEDMENRSFSLKMIENRNKKIDPTLDLKEIESIRNDLYSLHALYRIHPEVFHLEELFQKSIGELTEKDSAGRHVCDYLRASNDNESLIGRSLDIATTYYPLSRLTCTEADILSLLTDEQRYSTERLKETIESRIHHSLVLCCNQYAKDHGVSGFGDIITRVPTKDITDLYNRIQEEDGNQRNSMDRITGNKVTRTLRDLGFDIRTGTGGKSYIKWTEDIDNILDINQEKFGTEEDQVMLEILRKRGMKSKS